ncbi:MAG: glycosyltransferase family 2 protein [Deltaproteobacteria bacterium]|nr:glycosyltransferase family 2 protein [Deltaproteobacteria bacterium]
MNCKNNNPIISIVIPSRNERNYIGACLDSVLNQGYGDDRLDVIVVDGMSEDGTREIVREYLKKYSFIRMLDNYKRVTPAALNVGVKNARGEYILILGSHSELGDGVLRIIADKYRDKKADCIGGLIKTLPGDSTVVANAIALALSHPFGVGRSYFRIGMRQERYVNTVPYGCYRKGVFEKIGMFDEDLVRNQDDEFNLRLFNRGGKLLLVPQIISKYYARGSLKKLWMMFYQYGYFKPLVAKKVGIRRTWRQMIPAFFVIGLFASVLSFVYDPLTWKYIVGYVGTYMVVNIYVSSQSARKKGWKILPILPIVFLVLHLGYGMGYLKGIFDFTLSKQNGGKIDDMPITR